MPQTDRQGRDDNHRQVGQKKPHPLLVTELSARAQFGKLLAMLNLHVSEPWG